jgi:hypothetical protein
MPAVRKPEWAKAPRSSHEKKSPATRCQFWSPIWCGRDGRGCHAEAVVDMGLPDGSRRLLCAYCQGQVQINYGATVAWLTGAGLNADDRVVWEHHQRLMGWAT